MTQRANAVSGSVIRRWTRSTTYVVIGAGCAGMRAAIAGPRRGRGCRRRLEAPPDPKPLRRRRGRHQRGARKRSRGQPRDPHVRHGQGLRLPRRPGLDRDPLPRGARRHLPARALGSRLLARRGRPARAASVRRRGLAAHGLRSGHHRPRPDPGALRAARQARHHGLRGVLRLAARHRRRPLPGRDRVGPPARRSEGDRRQDDRAGHRRCRPPLPRDDERLRLHGRRDVDGAARRAAAEGHRVHAVPSDDDVPERDPDHRGLPRRGRDPAQLRGRALHGALRADGEGPGEPRRRLALRADGDRRGPRRQRVRSARPDAPRRGEDPHPPPGLARAGDGLCGGRPDPASRSRSARARTTTWAASKRTPTASPS